MEFPPQAGAKGGEAWGLDRGEDTERWDAAPQQSGAVGWAPGGLAPAARPGSPANVDQSICLVGGTSPNGLNRKRRCWPE